MSAFNLLLSVAQIALLQKAYIRPKRSFGGVVAHAIIEERHTDQVVVTEHPIEKGANIADHAYKLPVEVALTMGWSNSPAGAIIGGDASSYSIQEIYQAILSVQAKMLTFDILTAKRSYKDMFITGLSVLTNAETENALVIQAQCRQILFVTPEVVKLAPGAGTKQASPESTGATQSGGTRQPQDATYYNPSAGP